MVENLKDNVFNDLNGLTKDVNTLFVKLESMRNNSASTSQVAISHDALSQRLDLVNDNLPAKIDLVHTQLSSKIDTVFER